LAFSTYKQGRCLLPASCWFYAWNSLHPWRWRWHVPPKCRLIFNRLHGIIPQKVELFVTTVVRTLNTQNIKEVNPYCFSVSYFDKMLTSHRCIIVFQALY
jgi:hypothetical protein